MSNLNSIFDFKIYRSTIITITLVPVAIILFFFLQPSIAYENGPLENLQVAQLIFGSFVSYIVAKKAINHKERNIWYCGVATFLLFAGRELNWGRVFYPTGDHNSFISMHDLWYGSFVHPVLGIIILIIIYELWNNKIFSFVSARKIPVWNLLLFVFLYLTANYAEHRPMIFWGQQFDGEILEELFECLCYWLLTDITRIMGYVNRKNIDF